MITCPWCGTSYIAFQSNCQKCGGPLLPPAEHAPLETGKSTLKPPPAPRTIADKFVWSLMLTDGSAIVAGVFSLLGSIFTLLGLALTIAIVTAFVGLPFMGFGIVALGGGLIGLTWRYQRAQKILAVLRYGESIDGQIVSMEENLMVHVGMRHPLVIGYQFQLNGHDYMGSVATFNRPGLQLNQSVCVLYLPQQPEHNALYPHP